MIHLDEYADVGRHWISLYVKIIEIIYFDNSGVERVPNETGKFTGHINIKTNIFRIQVNS